jgi:hypothetical protein
MKRTVLSIASVLAVLAFCFSVFETTTLIGVALGGSLAFVILLLGYVVCWIMDYFQKPEMKTSKDDPV